jgi:uncharacterized protein (DUF1697 family)
MAGQCWVAFLRGINVGTAKRVAMADLREIVERLGYQDVTTLLNSGNVVFRTSRTSKTSPARAIEDAVKKRLGVSSAVMALRAAELDAILRDNPLAKPSRNPALLLVAMVRDAAALSRLAELAKQDWGPEQLACGRAAGYIWCPGGSIAGDVFSAVNKALGDGVTTRNWSTMLKLQAMTRRPTTND